LTGKEKYFDNRYRIVKYVASGAQSETILAEDTFENDRKVLIKIYPYTNFSASALYEYRGLASLSHPSIVRVFGLGDVSDIKGKKYYIVEEWIDGTPVHLFSSNLRNLDDREGFNQWFGRFLMAVSSALEYIHSKGILHRDIKPNHILVSGQENECRFTLIDFGLSAFSEGLKGRICGTPGYIAPECFKGHYSPLSDLYSLGVTAFVVAGGNLFELARSSLSTEKFAAPLILIKEEQVRHYCKILNSFFLETIIKLLKPNPLERFPSAKALLRHIVFRTPFELDFRERESGSQIQVPSIIGRDSVINEVVECIEKRFTGGTNDNFWLVVLKGPRGIGKTAIAEEIKRKVILKSISHGKGIPMIIEGGGMFFTSSGTLRSGSPIIHQNVDFERSASTFLDMVSEKEEGVLIFMDNPDLLETRFLEMLSSRIFKNEKVHHKLFFVIEIDTDTGNTSGDSIYSLPGRIIIDIPPLSSDDMQVLIRSLLGEKSDPSLVEVITERSKGIPLFAIQLASLTISKNLELEELSLPEAVQEAVSFFLKKEPPEIVMLTRCLALSIVPLSTDMISSILNLTKERVVQVLETLSVRGWMDTSSGEIKLHPLVADAILKFTGKSDIKEIHLKLAQSLSKSKIENDFPADAYHFFMGGNYSFGEKIVERAEHFVSKMDFKSALKLLENPLNESPESLGSRGKILAVKIMRNMSKYEKALEVLDSITESQDDEINVEKILEKSAIYRLMGNKKGARELLEKFLLSKQLAHSINRTRVVAILSRILIDSGEYGEAMKLIEQAITEGLPEIDFLYLVEPLSLCAIFSGGELSEPSTPLRYRSDVVEGSRDRKEVDDGVVVRVEGEEESGSTTTTDFEKARKVLEEGIEIARKLQDEEVQSRLEGLLGIVNQKKGKYTVAVECYERAAELSKKSGNIHAYSTYSLNLGSALMEMSKFKPAMEKFNEAIRVLERIGGWHQLAVANLNCANLRVRIGDIDGGKVYLAKCIKIIEKTDRLQLEPLINMIEGDIAFAEENFEIANNKYLKAKQGFDTLCDLPMSAQAALSAAEAFIFDGKIKVAEQILKEIENSPAIPLDPRIKDRHTLIVYLAFAREGKGERNSLDILNETAESFASREEMEFCLQTYVIALWLSINISDFVKARFYFSKAGEVALKVKQEASSLGYDPSVTNVYMKILRRFSKVKEKSMDSFLGGDSFIVDKEKEKWIKLARINKRINSELRLRPLLELVLDTMLEITEGVRGYIILKDEAGNLRVKCARNMDSKEVSGENFSFSSSIVKKVIETGKPLISVDASSDSSFHSSKSVVELNLKSVISVPLFAKGKILGAIYADNPYGSNMFTEEDINLLMTFADQAAIALENARLIRENMMREKKIERLNRKLSDLLGKQKIELEAMRETIDRTAIRRKEGSGKYMEIVGESSAMQKVFRLLDRIADTELPAVIIGESGTGKELVARAIHFASKRASQPFVTQNCGAVPDTLLESILFGHIKGAFTGADRNRPGLFEMADHGTLFLDEISSMSNQMQIKLLRTLQDGVVRPLGSDIEKKVDVRILAASSTRLEKLVEEGKFREDLYFRINVISIEIPPLRDRKEDIPLLVNHFLEKHGKGKKLEVLNSAMKKLINYDWPGNVRQLENEIMRAIVLSEGKITEEDVLQDVPATLPLFFGDSKNFDLKVNVEKLERVLIEAVLTKTGGNKSKASKLLGISRFGLLKKMEKYGILKNSG